jgi:hypothetical protein
VKVWGPARGRRTSSVFGLGTTPGAAPGGLLVEVTLNCAAYRHFKAARLLRIAYE